VAEATARERALEQLNALRRSWEIFESHCEKCGRGG